MLSCLAYRLDGQERTDAATAVYEEVLRLNPHDNHGHRAWLTDRALRQGDDMGALALADQFPDDALADTLFGRASRFGAWDDEAKAKPHCVRRRRTGRSSSGRSLPVTLPNRLSSRAG